MAAIRLPLNFTCSQRGPCPGLWRRDPRPSRCVQYRCTNHQRDFHTTIQLRQRDLPDHYKTLDVPPSASVQEIRASFISLSKKHHPDVTRSLPDNEKEAHEQKFRAASDAWALLRDKNARAKYDRERGALLGEDSRRASTSSGAGHTRGGRPASGLSKRQTPFRGPPPSFYKQGGWGSSEAADRRRKFAEGQREKAHQSADAGHTRDAERPRSQSSDPENWPFNGDPNDVPHFNRRQHYRTTTTVEQQMRQGRNRRREELLRNLQDAATHDRDVNELWRESNVEVTEQAMARMKQQWEATAPEQREPLPVFERRLGIMRRKIESLRQEPAVDDGQTLGPLILVSVLLVLGTTAAVTLLQINNPSRKEPDKSR